ncbi:hypothetical protein DPMN_126174 [Dreissena polymorpha]|uniref:Uncharacterized protein n=1 Tax=Dreissena polymorpha TaxID=45954 RepID=A0A9D4GZN1_DREPO|nr:hypothetical protein DPMN_126174 [Dreissena polymorpha]
MAQADNKKANLLAYLHLRIARRVLRRLLEYCVARENAGWTIDQFLYQHMSRINQHPIGNQNQRHLFPGFGVRANVDQWPVYLFSLLIDITASGLCNSIHDSVSQINQARLELFSNIVIGISDEYLGRHVNGVKLAIQTICQFLNEGQFTTDINQEILNVELMLDSADSIDYVEEFKTNHYIEKSYRQRLNKLTPDQQQLHEIIRQTTWNTEEQEDEPHDVSIRDEDHRRDVEEARRQGYDPSNRSVPPRSVSSKYPIAIPEFTVEIEISGCDGAELHSVSERVVNSINSTDGQEMDSQNRQIKNTCDNTFTSFGAYYARQGCIQIVVRPRSVNAMFQLLKDCINGNLTKSLQPLQELIRTFSGCQNYTQEVVLYKDNYDYVMDNIALQLTKQITVSDTVIRPKHKIRAEVSEPGRILLHMECHSAGDRAAFKFAIEAGKMQPTLDVLKTELGHIYPNLSLNARLNKQKETVERGSLQNDDTSLKGV